jgi:hypothetical protein
VAAAQLRPVGLNVTQRVRMAGAFLPPVPGRASSPAAPPAAVTRRGTQRDRGSALEELWSCRRRRGQLAQRQGTLRAHIAQRRCSGSPVCACVCVWCVCGGGGRTCRGGREQVVIITGRIVNLV